MGNIIGNNKINNLSDDIDEIIKGFYLLERHNYPPYIISANLYDLIIQDYSYQNKILSKQELDDLNTYITTKIYECNDDYIEKYGINPIIPKYYRRHE